MNQIQAISFLFSCEYNFNEGKNPLNDSPWKKLKPNPNNECSCGSFDFWKIPF